MDINGKPAYLTIELQVTGVGLNDAAVKARLDEQQSRQSRGKGIGSGFGVIIEHMLLR
jgi:hypothetical protein